MRISNAAKDESSLNYVVVNYTYNARNQLVTETSGTSTKTYAYSKNGNTTDIVETVGAAETVVGTVVMDYDELNRMTDYSGPEGTETFEYRGAEWHRCAADSKSFMYDGDNVVADLDGADIDRTYVTPFLDQNLSMGVTSTSSLYYYSHDGLGSVRTVTDALGDGQNRYDYSPFGAIHRDRTSISHPVRYGYTGREHNRTSNQSYHRYRHLDRDLGRFQARDPLGELVGANFYTYCDSGPVAWVDSWGLDNYSVSGIHGRLVNWSGEMSTGLHGSAQATFGTADVNYYGSRTSFGGWGANKNRDAAHIGDAMGRQIADSGDMTTNVMCHSQGCRITMHALEVAAELALVKGDLCKCVPEDKTIKVNMGAPAGISRGATIASANRIKELCPSWTVHFMLTGSQHDPWGRLRGWSNKTDLTNDLPDGYTWENRVEGTMPDTGAHNSNPNSTGFDTSGRTVNQSLAAHRRLFFTDW